MYQYKYSEYKKCRECGCKYKIWDKGSEYHHFCKKCKKKLLNKLEQPLNLNNYFLVNDIVSVDFSEEYHVAPELEWINNARYSTDYWMYNNMALCQKERNYYGR